MLYPIELRTQVSDGTGRRRPTATPASDSGKKDGPRKMALIPLLGRRRKVGRAGRLRGRAAGRVLRATGGVWRALRAGGALRADGLMRATAAGRVLRAALARRV